MPPSQILRLAENRIPDTTIYDFDSAVGLFTRWFDGKLEEKRPGQPKGPKLGKGQEWVPKYETQDDVFDLYGRDDDAERIDHINTDDLTERMISETEAAF